MLLENPVSFSSGLLARRKQYLMLGMVITVFHLTLMIVIIQFLSPHGADTTIVQGHVASVKTL